MHSGDADCRKSIATPRSSALLEMTARDSALTAVVDAADKVVGGTTDGDLRRALEHALDLQQARVTDLMTQNPRQSARTNSPCGGGKNGYLKINGLLVVDADNTCWARSTCTTC
jgi:arabinose-5-phosphate isomerase